MKKDDLEHPNELTEEDMEVVDKFLNYLEELGFSASGLSASQLKQLRDLARPRRTHAIDQSFLDLDSFASLPCVVQKELEYHETYAILETALRYIIEVLSDFNADYSTKWGIRHLVSTEGRVKTWASVTLKLWKALRHLKIAYITVDEVQNAFNNIHDLVGVRLEVTYCDRVKESAGLLRTYLADRGFEADLAAQGIIDKDYLDDDRMGYRAYHIGVQNIIKDASGINHSVTFEIQIRSSLQQVWARLMNHLIYDSYVYRGEDIPPVIIISMCQLSALIHAADVQLASLRKHFESEQST